MIRMASAALFVLVVFVGVTVLTTRYQEKLEPTMYEYMVENFQRDTAAHNAVAAILLNYRMYDTMFEALILLTAIIGMKQFLPSAGEFTGGKSGRGADTTDWSGDSPKQG